MSSEKHRNRNSLVVTLAVATLAPVVVAFSLFVMESVPLTFALFYGGVCLLVPAVDFLFVNRLPLKACAERVGFRMFRRLFPAALAPGLLFGGAVYGFFLFIPDTFFDGERIGAVLREWRVGEEALPWLLVVMIILNPLFEEFYWRGYILYRASETAGKRASLLISSAFYASYHLLTTGCLFSWIHGLLLSSAVFAAGLFWGILRYRTRSLYPEIIAHLFADAGIMAAYAFIILPHIQKTR